MQQRTDTKMRSRTPPTSIPISIQKRLTLAKWNTGGNLFRKNTNRTNGEPYFNPVKEAIVDSSDHTVTLENGLILRKSDQAIERKRLPSPSKILVNTHPNNNDSSCFPSLAQSYPTEDDQWELDLRKPDARTNDHKFVDRNSRNSGFPSEIVRFILFTKSKLVGRLNRRVFRGCFK